MTNAQRFHELTGKDKNDVWNNFIGFRSSKFHCSCGLNFNYHNDLLEHIKESNPTYSNAADILNRTREFCGEERYIKFLIKLKIKLTPHKSIYDEIELCFINFIDQYILNPSALLERACEFLEEKKGNE